MLNVSSGHIPSYLRLPSGELDRRVEALDRLLESCTVCPWDCHVNRLKDETKVCVAGYLPIVSSYAPHFGEEPALSGTHLGSVARGSGNIFLGHCNMRCVYCQNWQISQDFRTQRPTLETGFERLAGMTVELQERGCHNIGFVSPTHFAPQIARALAIAVRGGLHLPLVYNTNAYDSVEVLRLLDGVFDIYLPDLKYSDEAVAQEYSKIPHYVASARAAIKEMHRQLSDEVVMDERGLLRRGLVIRLLVLPNDMAGIRETLEWIREELSPRVTLSVMSQYYVTHTVERQGNELFPLLNRRIRPREYEKVLEWVEELGFENGWVQPLEAEAADYYRPNFNNPGLPFEDARDFQPAAAATEI
jgi:putative pyruvate formate lyase activating enzyme